MRPKKTSLLSLVAALLAAAPAFPQSDSVTVVPGPHYAPRSALHEWLLGRRYRDLWTTPITVPLLDLESYSGGLTPVSVGGNQQTFSLRLVDKEGREFNFRSVDKELTPAMPDYAKETFLDWVRQDQTKAQLPASPVVAGGLLDAAGVLHPEPQLMVMSDDPRLGEFRDQFAGLLGTFERHADEGPGDRSLFHDAITVAGTDRLLEHLHEDLDDRVDSRAFLKARLMDVFMGDWDRHDGQWRWARYDRGNLRWWVPVPEDRDYAFVHYDGILLELVRRLGVVRMIEFEPEYANLLAMVDNSLAITQRLLGDLPYEVWDSTAVELQRVLTDEVIQEAVQRMPRSHAQLFGDELAAILRVRRDALREVARDFFLLLSEAAEVHGTEHGDALDVRRNPDGSMEVVLLAGADSTYPPRFHRVFQPGETEEVRIYLYEGDDRVQVVGEGSNIGVRVIGGLGDDHLEDRSSGPTAFYDSAGDNTFLRGRKTSIHTRPSRDEIAAARAAGEEEETEEPTDAGTLLPRPSRNWGESFSTFTPSVEWRGPAELVVGGGPTYTRYGFRHEPYASRFGLDVLYAPLHTRFEVQLRADFRRESSDTWLEILGVASQLDATNFRGLGNDSPALDSDASRVWHDRLGLEATLHRPIGSRWSTYLTARADYITPRPDPGTPAAALPAVQTDATGRVGAEAGVAVDRRNDPVFPTGGFRVQLSGSGYLPVWDVREEYGRVDGVATGYLPLRLGFPSVLAFRAGGGAAFGAFPFHEAVFLGGSRSLRGHGLHRFAGDAAAFGGAEWRVPITPAEIFVHGTLGISAFADAGRVYLEGESPGGWHAAFGGSLWFAMPVGALTFSYAHGEDDRIYVHFGLPF